MYVLLPHLHNSPLQFGATPRPLPTRDPRTFLYFLQKLLPSSSRMDTVHTNEPRDLLDVRFLCMFASKLAPQFPLQFSATLPLPRPLINPNGSCQPTPTTQSSVINTTINLVALSDRSCIAGYCGCSFRAG
ncbi:hypothetical protein BDR04DRAFT_574789 [Suillus decipiens]|nr:hypothetical protein BDR04DRAFT_574789 [Suillus decipiens]